MQPGSVTLGAADFTGTKIIPTGFSPIVGQPGSDTGITGLASVQMRLRLRQEHNQYKQ
jgi:hypothetical protein